MLTNDKKKFKTPFHFSHVPLILINHASCLMCGKHLKYCKNRNKKKIPDILRDKILRQMRDICQENASRIKLQKHYLIHTKKSLDMMWLEPKQLSRE